MRKLILLVRRRPGMTREAFRDHYEHVHAPLVAEHLPGLRKYTRNYLEPLGTSSEVAWDCVTEMWFDNALDLQRALQWVRGDAEARFARDEENFMDRATMTAFLADEAQSALDLRM